MTGESHEVLTNVEGGVGFVTLNRPKAINSLNQTMVDLLATVLMSWEHEDAVHAVVLSGAGERGLCAGGVGVSAHANTRVVTDTSKVAMPEVGIGFIPDVGGVYLLSRAPGALGLHAALTGAPFSGADAIALGFADHFVPHGDLDAFTQKIVTGGVESALAAHAVEPPPSTLAAQRDWIDECYAGDSVADIVAALRKQGGEPAVNASDLIASRSPIALSVTLQAVRRAAKLDTLEDVLIQDYRVSSASLRSHDLVEGIRAQLIDKDRNPNWSPATLDAITAADIEAYFEPVDDDLSF
ncbi:enoyl-CoA hydratase/isomerase family protein [Mycobacterium tuberculosis]|uniref:enoyl-CoA hydratase/isomerase family protein n=1 Tax=Mycobacterium tuberculosis TaxID=1773 RepID=UPI00045A9EA6|nr:enoyl-CoA hydratase/isomerase family protein [Mycobacterium tuberculosis]KCL53292.1 enoyl-CoA hydratase EchA9 [Mycobacterium tuberculosis TB_RSA169]